MTAANCLAAARRLAYAIPDRRSIEEWGAGNVTLPPVLTKRGKFDVAGSRQFIAPFQAMRSDRVRGVRVLAPVRGGKTLIADISVPWGIVNDNASVLWVFQSDPIAEAHAETRQMPILLSVPAIAAMLHHDRHKKRNTNILFANGLPLVLQGPALGGLQARGFKWVVCDEAWLYKPGILANAKARLGDFVKTASSKFLAISQGGAEESDWDQEVKNGELYTLNVRCFGCAELIAPEWTLKKQDRTLAGAVFDSIKLEGGGYDKDACAASVRFVCPKCGHSHPNTEKTRAVWNLGATYLDATGKEWNPANPPSEVSFRWHALIDYPWGELVKMWLEAQEAKHVGNFAPLVAFFQKRCALMRSERTIHDGDMPFARVRMETDDPKAKAWPDEAGRFLTADRQSEDVYWVTIRAWSETGESRRLWFGKLYSETAIEAKRAEFAVQPDCTVIDSGYKPKGDHGVYSACIRYEWIAAKGTEEPFFWHTEQGEDDTRDRVQKPWAPLSWGDPGEGTTNEGRTRAPLIRFSSGVMADRVTELIARGLWVEPELDENAESEKEYRTQMSAEFKRWVIKKPTFKRVEVWVCPSGNNHAFDCSKMQVLCAMQSGFLPNGLERGEQKPASE